MQSWTGRIGIGNTRVKVLKLSPTPVRPWIAAFVRTDLASDRPGVILICGCGAAATADIRLRFPAVGVERRGR